MSGGVRTERLGWDLAAGVLFLVILGLAVAMPERTPGSRAVMVVVAFGVVSVYAFGARRYVGIHTDACDPSPAVSALLQSALVGLLALGAAFEPNMLILQTIVLPLLWMTSRSTRQAVLVTIANAVVLALAYSFWGGFQPQQVLAGFVTAGLSAAFALGLGLWITRIAEWGAERQRLLAELTQAQAGLEAASREAGASAERARMSRDVHDTIAQSLTSIVMLAERARRSGSTETIGLIEEAARDALREARALVVAAAPAPDPSASLADALRRLGDRFSRETGMAVAVSAADATLPRDVQVVLLRCAQEGLANVRKHSRAAQVSVVFEAGERARLTVRDDGIGLGGVSIDDDRGFGLAGMRDRVALVGGSLTVADRAGAGVELTVEVPVSTAGSEVAR